MIVLAVCGCKRQAGSLQERLDEHLQVAASLPIATANYRKPFYTYYTEPAIGHLLSRQTSNVFVYDHVRFIMNLNVYAIIGAQPDLPSVSYQKYLIANSQGSYRDIDQKNIAYQCEIYRLQQRYVLFFHTDTVNFCAVGNETQVLMLAQKMYMIARSIHVREEAVLAAYTNEHEIQYQGEEINLYKDIAPEEGTIQELIHDKSRIDSVSDKNKSVE